jgi:hypothetical protein
LARARTTGHDVSIKTLTEIQEFLQKRGIVENVRNNILAQICQAAETPEFQDLHTVRL